MSSWSCMPRITSARLFLVTVISVGAIACDASVPVRSSQAAYMDEIAERYVKLVLAMGAHDADYVDAYYGPPEWRVESDRQALSLVEIGTEADGLMTALDAEGVEVEIETDVGDEITALRHAYLRRQLEALRVRVRMLSGEALTFDDESRALYDAVSPTHPESYFEGTLTELDSLLPGTDALVARYDAFRKDFVIAPARLDRVFDEAIGECRARTSQHVELPATESFTVEFVTDKSWSGYNWYQGDYRSLIQVNTDFPIYIDRAIDLACHEGYPGHHVYNVLLEKHLVRDRGWPEFSVYALFSPQSLIAEGTANYGIEVAFPDDERPAFERDVLFPAAGLDPMRAEEYERVQTLVRHLAFAGNEAARRYLNQEIDRTEAISWLTQYAMMSPDRAEQRTRFFDQYRSYVINYNLGQDLVRAFVESRSDGRSEQRWSEFAALLASPRLPSGLQVDEAQGR